MERDFNYPPLVFNVYKPRDMSSIDVVKTFKKFLPPHFGKIGHFGTLDPFAEGVLMIGVAGGARINDYVHKLCPKTYIATGILGLESETGDLTEGFQKEDNSDYLHHVISSFSKEFIDGQIQCFVGDYMQSPHVYSACKFEGRPLHAWAREGVVIKKAEVKRHIYSIKVLEYDFPKLVIEATVSSGTYIRTLFSDIAKLLGTYGVLKYLVRSKVGEVSAKNSITRDFWPDKNEEFNPLELGLAVDAVLKLPEIHLNAELSRLYRNGIGLETKRFASHAMEEQIYWVYNSEGILIGLGNIKDQFLKIVFNIPLIEGTRPD